MKIFSNKGLTLIEGLVVLSVFTITLGFTTTAFPPLTESVGWGAGIGKIIALATSFSCIISLLGAEFLGGKLDSRRTAKIVSLSEERSQELFQSLSKLREAFLEDVNDKTAAIEKLCTELKNAQLKEFFRSNPDKYQEKSILESALYYSNRRIETIDKVIAKLDKKEPITIGDLDKITDLRAYYNKVSSPKIVEACEQTGGVINTLKHPLLSKGKIELLTQLTFIIGWIGIPVATYVGIKHFGKPKSQPEHIQPSVNKSAIASADSPPHQSVIMSHSANWAAKQQSDKTKPEQVIADRKSGSSRSA